MCKRSCRNLIIAALVLAPAARASAAEPSAGPAALEGVAAELARLRGEIEALDARLDEQKESRRAQLRALGAQKSAGEMELQREELRARQLSERVARMNERARASGARQESMGRAVLESIELLARPIEQGIPFRVRERREALAAIARELDAGTLQPAAAIGRVWEWVDKELELTRGSELVSQVIVIDGRETLAEVARMGMVAMYFRASENRFGFAHRDGERWVWEVSGAPPEQERISALFAALEKDPARGWFVLPATAGVEMLGVNR